MPWGLERLDLGEVWGWVGMCTGALGFRCNRVWMNGEGVSSPGGCEVYWADHSKGRLHCAHVHCALRGVSILIRVKNETLKTRCR